MKSKAPLALMEQMVMLLVFAVAAALCLQAFVKSEQISLRSQARSNAALAAQNIAEMIRHSGGSPEHAFRETADRLGGDYLKDAEGKGGNLVILYDEEWEPVAEEGAYLLAVQEIPAEEEGLHKVLIKITDSTYEEGVGDQEVLGDHGEVLFEMEAAWLEVNEYE